MCFAALLPAAAAAGAGSAAAAGAGFFTATSVGSIGASAAAGAAATSGFSLASIGQIFSVASSVFGALTSNSQQNAQAQFAAQQAQRNAELARFYAAEERATGESDARKHALQVRELISRQSRNYAGAGVLPYEGTPLDVVSETAQYGSADTRTIRANAERKARAQELRASGFDQEAQISLSQITSPIFGVASTLLEAGAPVAAKWYSNNRAFDPMV